MNLMKCLLIENDCYKAGAGMKPRGVMVHSTGVNNPNLRRYVQPVAGQENYSGLIAALGKNSNGNHWNRHIDDPNKRKCVHAFIGKLADGSIATVQTLPWEMQAWHCYYGPNGSGNATHISFEICEDNLDDPVYFRSVYKEAVEFTAYLCKLYGLDPLADGVVICHKEGARRGIASNHSDVENWFPRMGYSMDGFRQDVKDLMTEEKEEEDMKTYDTVSQIRAEASWAAPTIEKLCMANALRGGSEAKDAEGYPVDLHLSEDALRILVINDRMGLYSK